MEGDKKDQKRKKRTAEEAFLRRVDVTQEERLGTVLGKNGYTVDEEQENPEKINRFARGPA